MKRLISLYHVAKGILLSLVAVLLLQLFKQMEPSDDCTDGSLLLVCVASGRADGLLCRSCHALALVRMEWIGALASTALLCDHCRCVVLAVRVVFFTLR